MSKSTSHTTTTTPSNSALDRFDLAFEYNVTWADEKKSVKERSR